MRYGHITEEQYEAMRENGRRQRLSKMARGRKAGPVSAAADLQGAGHDRKVSAVTSSPYKSKLEAAWANYLHGLWMLKTVTGYWYEPMNLRLPGERNFYKPDFLVQTAAGLTFYEVKGRNKSDDRSLVKLKTAAGLNTWARFVLVKRLNGQWVEREMQP